MYTYINPSERPGLAKQQKKVLFTVIIILFCLVLLFGFLYVKERNAGVDIQDQLKQRILNSISKAIDTVPAESSVNSATASKVGNLKGYAAAVNEMNQISISIYGEEGRILPQEIIDLIYNDLEEFDRLLQQSTVSTITVRTNLNTHLNAARDEVRK